MHKLDKDFFAQAFALKQLDRAGWLRAGIQNPESVAAHSWGLALLCLKLAPKDLDLQRVLSIALVHDLPEVIAGDITPHDGFSKQEKQAFELKAAQELLPPDLYVLWLEYEENQTKEAQFVHQMDKLDMLIQAENYAQKADTSEFIISAKEKLKNDFGDLC